MEIKRDFRFLYPSPSPFKERGTKGVRYKMRDKPTDFKCFLEQLISATAKIESKYFHFPVAGAESTIYRERVYCYELYHQLRCTLGNEFPYTLDGEVDKKAHKIIEGNKKPDFIVHTLGIMEENLAVIEVKSKDAETQNIKVDIDKLIEFLKYYYRAIMLIYGDDENKVKSTRNEIDSLPEHSESILLLWHKEPGKPAEEYSNARTA
ncbi:MAG: hypothetical protein A2Z28_01810 [Chloroflexi bacterium RBG_16_51_9]|nr:MAG: hypothetical protein A2Z28_01810 [Chloroflexi bacterium RBG_16_51_9]